MLAQLPVSGRLTISFAITRNGVDGGKWEDFGLGIFMGRTGQIQFYGSRVLILNPTLSAAFRRFMAKSAGSDRLPRGALSLKKTTNLFVLFFIEHIT
jgi:hypothetical protein